ncbi:MAG: carboxylating nicotinate-nucleotide diphosphorylase [Candidatus Jordarchaeales archaeon]|nr:carboxylating nicotinate-nucleotide diphosphorylase [Candidatus Jordarchaeia archaeon]
MSNIRGFLASFLLEDLGFGDVTSEAVIPENVIVEARIVCKEDGVIAGVSEASELFKMIGIDVVTMVRDGERVKKGDVVMELRGDARAILGAERTVLNLMMLMSGVATETARLVEKARRVNGKVRVAGTRKTTPGFRYFEKKAIELGGGDPHRFRLDDLILIKDNHIKIVGSVAEAIKRAKEKASFSKKIEVEVSSPNEALEAVLSGADIIMLDNMSVENVEKTIRNLKEHGLREKVIIEVSGGINFQNIEEYAALGVDVISTGHVTHSSKALDLSLDIVKIISLKANN